MHQVVLVICAALATQAHSATSQKCFDGALELGGHQFQKEQILDMLLPQVLSATSDLMQKKPDFKSFMESRGACQIECYEKLLPLSMSTLYGKLGQGFTNTDKATIGLVTQALTGAFMACFPSHSREDAVPLVKAVVDNMGKGPPKDTSKMLSKNAACTKHNKSEFPPSKQFLEVFGKAFQDTVGSNDGVKQFFSTQAKDCQLSCLKQTVLESQLSLFLSNNDENGKALGQRSLTGAMKACFPGIPHSNVQELVGQVMNKVVELMSNAPSANEKLYDQGLIKPQGRIASLTSLQTIGFIAAMGLSVFVAVTVGRKRMRVHGQELTLVLDSEKGIE